MKQGRPSQTAFKVASNLITLGTKDRADAVLPPGVGEATERVLLEAGLLSPRTLRIVRSRWLLWVYELADKMLFEGLGHRKMFCEREVRAAIDAGATQVLVLGAGYDTLCWRLAPEYPEVRFFEIDHPATSFVKVRAIEAMGRPANMAMIAENLAETSLRTVLTAAIGWTDARSVVVAEGLLMYLAEDDVRTLFENLVACTGPESRLVFTHVEPGDDGRPSVGRWTRMSRISLRLVGEPLRWSIHRDGVATFLAGLGWRSVAATGGPEGAGVERFVIGARVDDQEVVPDNDIDRTIALVLEHSDSLRSSPPERTRQFAAAGLMRCCALLKGVCVLEDAGLGELSGILARQHWETWLLSLHVLLRGEEALQEVEAADIRDKRLLAERLKLEVDYKPDWEGKPQRLYFEQLANGLEQLLRDAGETGKPSGIASYDLTYRVQSLFAVHAGLATFRPYLHCGESSWSVDPHPQTLFDSQGIFPALRTLHLAKHVFEAFKVSPDGLEQLWDSLICSGGSTVDDDSGS